MTRFLAVLLAGVVIGTVCSPLVPGLRCSTAYANRSFAVVCR